jgi:hypothetical protein
VLDLSDGSVRRYPTVQPRPDRWVMVQDLAFSPDGHRLAFVRHEGPIVDGSYEPPQDPTVPATLQVLDLATAEITSDAIAVPLQPKTGEDLHTPVWRDADTLWVAAEPGYWDDAYGSTGRVLELHVDGGPPKTVIQRDASIARIDLDGSRTRLLWIERDPKVPGDHAERDALWTLDGNAARLLARDVAAADW